MKRKTGKEKVTNQDVELVFYGEMEPHHSIVDEALGIPPAH